MPHPRLRSPATSALLLACGLLASAVAPPRAAAQSPDSAALLALTEGARIRATGPGIRERIRPSFRDVLEGGFLALLIRPPADGVVVAATPASLRFAASRRSQLLDVPWPRIERVDVHRGRSVPLGAAQGAGAGALGGLVMWGLIELIFAAADNPVVDDPGAIIGISAGAGLLVGAVTLGDRWERVYGR